jgi:hypothetical protein
LRKLKTYLGRVIRDIARKIDGDGGLETASSNHLFHNAGFTESIV